MDLNIWTAAGLGMVVGFLCGVTIDDALDMWRASALSRGKPFRIRRPSQTTLLAVGLATVLVVNGVIGVALIGQRARSDAFAQCLETSGQAQRALDAIVFAVASDDRGKLNSALKDYIALRSRPPSELCGVRR